MSSLSDEALLAGELQELLEAVFERFWQANRADRRGVGLGLYISRQIVEAHGGKIWAESTLGEGSVFTLTLPRVYTGPIAAMRSRSVI